MLEQLAFEYIEPSGNSRCIGISLQGDHYLVKTAKGYLGLYSADNFLHFTCPVNDMDPFFSERFAELKIYGWRKEYRKDPVSAKSLWSLTYKETEKKTRRVINGSQLYPERWDDFLNLLYRVAPDTDDLKLWIFRIPRY